MNASEFYESLRKETAACALCGTGDDETLVARDRYGMDLRTGLCRACGFVFTNPRPIQDEMNAFYNESYRKFYTGVIDPSRDYRRGSGIRKRAERLLAFLEPELSKVGSAPAVMDIGCGSGILLHCVRQRFPEAKLFGIDPDEGFAAYAKEQNGANVSNRDVDSFIDDATALPEPLDAMILNHVLEHLYSPVEKLLKLRRLIKDGGLLLVEVPNLACPAWRAPLEMFHLAHVQHFTPRTLAHALRMAGFEPLRQTSVPRAITFLCRKTAPVRATAPPIPASELVAIRTLRRRIDAPNTADRILLAWSKSRLINAATRGSDYLKAYGFAATLRRCAASAVGLTAKALRPLDEALVRPAIDAFRVRTHRSQATYFKKMIEGRRVLILGSGPSAAELDAIPDDVLVFSCNRGPKLLLDKNLAKRVDLYLCTRGKMERLRIPGEILRHLRTSALVVDNLSYIRRLPELGGKYEALFFDDGMDGFFLNALIAPRRARDIQGKSFHAWTSTGIRLLQYALSYGASEIYLAGVDLGQKGYFWGRNYERWLHDDIDENFLKSVAPKYGNIYAISEKSPLRRFVPYKNLDAIELNRQEKTL